MSIPNDSEERPLTLSELRALAEDIDRRDELAPKARGGANQTKAKRRKVPDVPEKVLLALAGKKAGATIVFGSVGETQLIFRPSKGRVKGAARWTVFLPPVPISGYDIDRELSKANRGLWDKEKGEPSVAFKAVRELLACHVEKLEALRVEVRQLHELNERPKIEVVMEQLFKVIELLDTVSDQLLRAQAAIGLVVEVLSTKELVGKLKIAFDLLRDDSQWLQDVTNLRFHAVALANELQRPPKKAELRKRHDPDGRMDPSQFTKLLRHAGLSWLPRSVFGNLS